MMRATRWTLAAAVTTGLVLSVAVSQAPAGAAGAGPTATAATAAGAPDAGLARFYRQPIAWHPCQQNPQDQEGAGLDAAGARCADVTVPLDYAHPRRRTITVAISEMPAPDAAHRVGPMIINLGGPGIAVFGRVVDARQAMGEAGARFDLIGMDPRFTGRSTPLDCGWPQNWFRSAGADRASFDRMVRVARDLAGRCARSHGDLLRYASTANQARDMDVIRGALGAATMSYLGYSYGSYLGAMYTQLFGRHAGRIVLDSAIDPADAGVHVRGHGNNGPARERALRDWAELAGQHDDVLHLGSTGAQVVSLVDRIYQAAARHPLHVGRFTVDDTVVPALLVNPLSDDGEADALQLATFVQVLARAAETGSAESTPELDEALAGMLTGAASAFHSGQTAISCADAAVRTDPEWYWRAIQADRAAAPLFGPMNRIVSPCAFWPTTPAEQVRIGNGVPALITHADGDINATPELNQAMHRALTGSRLVTAQGVRTHGVYLFKAVGCIDDTVNSYLRTGVLPAQDLRCQP